ncbi:conserved hypothetical protein [Sphingobium faniae]|nr:conserved hypothetical protein [Sphingobium faniae]
MIKLVCHFRAKPGMSFEDFRDYYENRHVPLIRRLLPPMADYRRSYVLKDGSFAPGHVETATPGPDFDVVTECWFEDQAAYDAMLARTQDAEIGGEIARDEANFMDRDVMLMYLVDERRT